jgi:lipid II:glycine glycyltransferase (peptidoglycan interpeptide bridge formation enzyme)
MYKLNEITNKQTWNDFIINSHFRFYSFLQSWEWWELQKLSGKNTSRYAILKENKQIWSIQIIKVKAKRGNYYLIPHGPLIKWDYFKTLKEILPELKIQAQKDKMSFIRFNSVIENTKHNKQEYSKLWCIDAPMHEHVEDTHLLNLKKYERELFNNIKKKDRYYINRAIKQWVKIRIDNKKDHREKLIEMHQKHANKIGYHKFSKTFIDNLYKVFKNNISTIGASYSGETESILITIKFGETCVYYIAASNIRNPKFSPNYLCQWEAIKKAKLDGAATYNFWWVSPDENKKHPLSWVTKFKRKFSWYNYSLLHAQDLVLSRKYYINWCIETCRRLKRRYYYKKPH